MTPDQLIAEGRRLQRPSVFLRPTGVGPVAAVWYEPDYQEIDRTGRRCWLTVDARYVPGLPPTVSGYLNVLTDEGQRGGSVELVSRPNGSGTKLYAEPASVLPPIDAVFVQGSEAVGAWIESYGWSRTERYNTNFRGRASVDAYEEVWMREFPLFFASDIYAVLGGWHLPGADDDWHELVDEQLMVFTLRDSEPWVEAWRTRDGAFKVIQRIT